jgi:AraC-like DNA-binding protein
MASEYREQPVDPSLARWVECAWCLEAADPLLDYAVRPDGCLDILYTPVEGLRAVGAMTAERRFDFPAAMQCAGVRFRPGMAGAFLRVAPSELTDRTVPADERRSARELEERLRSARSPGETIALLLRHLPRPEELPNPVQRAIEALTAAQGAAVVEEAARQANLSPRQFQRRCLEESGLSPKHLCRVLRFRHACTLAGRAARPDWAAIAVAVGYYDQAHLIHDFREFAGSTPMSVFSNTGATSAS